jgi:hypothetical protein
MYTEHTKPRPIPSAGVRVGDTKAPYTIFGTAVRMEITVSQSGPDASASIAKVPPYPP